LKKQVNYSQQAKGFIMGAATDEQKQRGITDSTDYFYKDWMTVYGDEPNIELKFFEKKTLVL